MHVIMLSCLDWCSYLLLGIVKDKLQKWICWTVGPSLAGSLEPLAHRPNVASLNLFYGYSFSMGILFYVHLNWLNWFHLLILEGGIFVTLLDCTIFLSRFLDVTRMSTSTVSFLPQLDSGILCP